MNHHPASRQPNEKLQRERLLRGWSQQDVGDRIGTDGYTVSRWERSKALPRPYFRQKLCILFGKNSEELGLDWKEKRTSSNGSPDDAATGSLKQSIGLDQGFKEESQSLPAYWYLPHRRNPFFTGREHLLQVLSQVLSRKQSLSQAYALGGLSGIGKTQIVIEYAYRYFQQYFAIFWLNAETYDQVVSSFLSIAASLSISEPLKQEHSTIIAAVLRWLNMHSGWLLIIDNLEQIELLRDILPTGGQGYLLFTTRLRTLGTLAPLLEVMPLLPEESLQLLQRRTGYLSAQAPRSPGLAEESAAAQEIVMATGGLPLALDQIAAYSEAYKCRLVDVVELLYACPLRLWSERGTHTGHPLSVAKMVICSFEQLHEKNPVAADLLLVYCFLAPDEIPEKLLLEGRRYLSQRLQRAFIDIYHFNDITRELLACTLIQRHAERQTVTVHRLIQTVLRESLPEELQQQWSRRMILLMNQFFFQDREAMDGESLSWSEMLLPHAYVVIRHGERWKFTFPEVCSLLIKMALYLHQRSRYVEAQSLYLRALSIQEHYLEEVYTEQRSFLPELSSVSLPSCQYQKVEPSY